MPARQHTPRSGSPMLSDLPRGNATSTVRDRDFDSGTVELKPKVAPRSGSFAAPLRDSFFDLAQRYQTLRDAAFRGTGSKKPAPALAANRERRLTDIAPPPLPAPRERVVSEEPPEEPTLVQPLAARTPEAVPAESERRPTTMRPPPPPEPLPRMILPSSMPPALALPTNPPPPPAPPPSVWRPMLAAAALSATIGALVSGGFVALRSFSAPRATTASTSSSTLTPSMVPASTSTGPCPVGVSNTSSGTLSSTPTHTTSWSSITSSSNTTAAASLGGANAATSHSTGPAPLQVSVENLPLENSRGKLTEPHASTPAREVVHVAPAARSVGVAAPTAAERRRARKEAAAAAAAQHAAAKSNDDDDDDEAPKAELPPPPVPTKGPDKAIIAKAVARAASAATSCDSGPQSGRALITFSPSGNVQSVSLVESFGDQAVNGCVLRALGRAHVPPFAGGPVEVRKGLSW